MNEKNFNEDLSTSPPAEIVNKAEQITEQTFQDQKNQNQIVQSSQKTRISIVPQNILI